MLLLRAVGVRRSRGAWLVLGLVVGYAVLTGLRPSGVRAAAMTVAVCGAIVLERRNRSANAFALGWLAVLALNPADPFSLGCKLSFLSVFVLVWGVGRWVRPRPLTAIEKLVEESRPIPARILRAVGRAVGVAYLVSLVIWAANTPLVVFAFTSRSAVVTIPVPSTEVTKMATSRKPTVEAYSYLRFSRPEQATGDSLRRQTAAREKWLAEHPAVRLNTSLEMADLGTSGFRGEHRSDPDRHALAEFVALFRAGKITRGSYLLVENLDRLSRESVRIAVQFFLELVNGGIIVVQLSPQVVEYNEQMDTMSMMLAVVELSRGHSESLVKSERCGQAWQEKKRQAATTKEPVGRNVPCWLEVADRPKKGNGGRFVLLPDDPPLRGDYPHDGDDDGRGLEGQAIRVERR